MTPLPQYVACRDKVYFLDKHLLLGGYTRVSYLLYDCERGGPCSGGHLVDVIERNEMIAEEDARVLLHLHDFEVLGSLPPPTDQRVDVKGY